MQTWLAFGKSFKSDQFNPHRHFCSTVEGNAIVWKIALKIISLDGCYHGYLRQVRQERGLLYETV